MRSFGGQPEEKESAKEAKTELPVRWEQNQKAAVMEKMRKTVFKKECGRLYQKLLRRQVI